MPEEEQVLRVTRVTVDSGRWREMTVTVSDRPTAEADNVDLPEDAASVLADWLSK